MKVFFESLESLGLALIHAGKSLRKNSISVELSEIKNVSSDCLKKCFVPKIYLQTFVSFILDVVKINNEKIKDDNKSLRNSTKSKCDLFSHENQNISKMKRQGVEGPILPNHPKERKEYWIYSHEYTQKPYQESGDNIFELRKLNPEEITNRFHIFFDDEKGHIIAKRKIKKFVGKEGKEKLRLKRLLYLFLINVGKRVSFSQIKNHVMQDYKKVEETSDSAVTQLKGRLCEFTDQAISPFIEPSTSAESGAKGYLIKEENDGERFMYCMILHSGQQDRKT
jgi:hypothetical protein